MASLSRVYYLHTVYMQSKVCQIEHKKKKLGKTAHRLSINLMFSSE